ncbi:MAG: TrkH family potassium uptake protein [Acidobacteriota bacterium]
MQRTYLWGRWSPARVIAVAFAATIAVGTVALHTPWASAGQQLSWLDALFTATSATCVTGLVVVDTGSALSLGGQTIVLALIQIGGLGIMTLSTLALVLMGKRLRLRHRMVVADGLSPDGAPDLRAVILHVMVMTAAFELVGTILLAWRWPADSVLAALGASLFHAISAFNNAGFSLMSNSLTGFQHDTAINLTVMALIIAGGLGFPVISELASLLRPRRKRHRVMLTLHTKVVLAVTSALLLLGTAAIYLLEANGALAHLSASDRLMAAAFQAVTPRTAGFNTIPIAGLHAATLFVIVLLMFVGGSPGSTAGGVKTTALGTLIAFVWSRARGRESVDLFRRTIAEADVRRAVTVIFAAATALVVAISIFLVTEGAAGPAVVRAPAAVSASAEESQLFIELVFESVSALSTVGLTTGVTPTLSAPGRLLIILLMFAGRIGPLTLAVALGQVRSRGAYRYPEERVLVG